MIAVMCHTTNSLKLDELVAFQGDLKKRTNKDVTALAVSIQREGLIMPFAVWKDAEGNNKLLDGHGRLEALTKLIPLDNDISTQGFPVIYIDAENEDAAKKSLLQITSSYGKITKQGAVKFCASIPEYRAPAVNKFVHKPVKRPRKEKPDTEVIIKIAVPLSYEKQVREILSSTAGIRIL